jgi:predicted permease
VDALLTDVRYAARTLVRRPAFTLLAVVTLALGIGVNAVAYSAVNALVFKPFSFPSVGRLAWIMSSRPGNPHGQSSWPEYEELSRARAFDSMAAEGRMPLSLDTPSGAEQVWSLLVSANYFDVLGARPESGRLFSHSDVAGTPAVVVSHRFWRERLGGLSIAGRSIALNRQLFAVVGVLPETFQGPGGLYSPDVWLPLERVRELGLPAGLRDRKRTWLTLVGRLRDDAGPAEARAELAGISRQLEADHPATNRDSLATLAMMADGHPEVRGMRPALVIALAVVGVVLLIACFNVASLLLARAVERQGEIGLRVALGAGRGRIVRQLVTEGLFLSALGGGAALLLSVWSADLLAAFSLPAPIPQRLHISVDRRLVGYTLMMVCAAGVLPALLPAWHATRADLLRSFCARTPGVVVRSRARALFVVAQIAGSTLFLAFAVLLARNFWTASGLEPGFDTTHTLVGEIEPSLYGYDLARARVLADALVEKLAGLPGVRRAALADRVPFYVGFATMTHYAARDGDCRATQCPSASTSCVGPGHFDALDIPILRGRAFEPRDLNDRRTVIVSQALAQQLWRGDPAVGRTLYLGVDGEPVEIVGVAGDIRHRGPNETLAPHLYRPLGPDEYGARLSFTVRAEGDPRLLIPAIRGQVRALDPVLPLQQLKTMRERMEVPLWPARTAAGFFAICGSLALVLATVGLFGVTYYVAGQRTREFGLRVALGATRERVIALVVREGLRLTAAGVALGGVAAYIGARIIAGTLVGVSAADPSSYAAAAVLQLLVALVACALPAWRATKNDPLAALRTE